MDTPKMASVISVTANEGISVKNEHGDNKINPMALKMKENHHNNVSTATKPTLASTPITTNNTLENNQEKLPTDCEDMYSIKGRFAWKSIERYQVPYITRVINGVQLHFVSVRMAESQLLSSYLFSLHQDIYKCKSVKSYFITENEAKLLNDINYHTDFAFGNELFLAKKEFVVLLEDVQELCTFIEVCLKTLLYNIHTGRKENCGFIRINSESVVPYSIRNGQKYVPLFCFEGETEKLQHLAKKLENWNLAYLKFCCMVQGISIEYLFDESWTVISLDDIKNCYSTETNFEEYWPTQKVVTELLTNQKSIHINPSGAWISAPSDVVLAKNTIPHTVTASAPAVPQSMKAKMGTYRNEWPANQMVHSYSFQAQSPSTTTLETSIVTRNQSISAQCYNAGSTVSQGSSLMNGVCHVVPPPPPLIRACNTAPAIGNSVSYSNVAPSNQCITTMYTSMTNSNVISDSNQMRNSYSQCAINNSQAQSQLIQQQQYHRQQINTNLQTQLSNSNKFVHGRRTNNQPRNALRNAETIVTSVPTEVIDLPLPPSSSVPPTVQETSISPSVGWELTRIPERIWGNDTNISAYQIKKIIIQGKMIHCINANPYIYSDLLITLKDLVQIVIPSWTVMRCAQILQKYLKITLFCGNSEQLGVLWKKGLISSINPEDTPMAMVQDIIHWLNTGVGLLQLPHPFQPPNSLMQNAHQSHSNRHPPPPYM